MKQLYLLLWLSLLAGSSSCSRGYYGARPTPPAPLLAPPMLALATATVRRPLAPVASPASCPAASGAAPARLVLSTGAGLRVVGRASPSAQPQPVNYLAVKALIQRFALLRPSASAEVAGTPTGVEGLGEALLKIALLLVLFVALVAAGLTLLAYLVVRLVRKAKQPKR